MFSIFKTLVKAKPQPQKHGQNHTKQHIGSVR